MQLDNQALVRILMWANAADNEAQMDSEDYALAMRIAVQVGFPLLAKRCARMRLVALENEACE